jgi:hypothetical protein
MRVWTIPLLITIYSIGMASSLWSLETAFGINNVGGHQKYEIFHNDGTVLSRLTFPDTGFAPTLTLSQQINTFQLNLEITYFPKQGNIGDMVDEDYDMSKFYNYENTNGQLDILSRTPTYREGGRGIFNIEKKFKEIQQASLQWHLYWNIGYYYAHTSYECRDTRQWYPSGYDNHPNNTTEETAILVSGKTLTYKTRIHGPIIGLKAQSNWKKISFQLRGWGSPFMNIKDDDFHLRREYPKISKASHTGILVGSELTASVPLSPYSNIELSGFMTYTKGNNGIQTQTNYTDSTLTTVKSISTIRHAFYALQYGVKIGVVYAF